MSVESDIEWTDATWNPTRGCRKISPGCKHCYAETFAERIRVTAPEGLAGRLLWVIPLHRVAGRECPGNTHREAPRG